MPQDLIDLLWRDHADAPRTGARGPRSRLSVTQVVDAGIAIADVDGLAALTVRRLGERLGISAMSVYTHVNSRDDLLVLMADAVHQRMPRPEFSPAGWRARVRAVAEAELAQYTSHSWLLDVVDPRLNLGPGTIGRYDHELHAFDGVALDDVTRDAALTFVLDFVRAAARASTAPPEDLGEDWATLGARLEHYVGGDFPMATRVGAAAGASMQMAYSPDHAWTFGLERVLDGLSAVIESERAHDHA
ncbi:TetR/AcrR family transcriptional regulator [Microbacterium sp. NPDC056234]|uniref:TetR/AcrR family transcriptional regulator n=1 Tax=Microbacterium sp. NPDC056234 TaxID=3345757 RepID=UPI0035D63EDE